jgi:hypothetical protein
LPDGSLSSAPSASRDLSAAWISRVAGWTLPLAFALLFLNVRFQPRVDVSGATVALSDLAVLAAVAAAAARLDRGLLDRSRALWIAAGVFLAFVAAASLYPRLSDEHYAWKTHLVTAAKYGEYALLAPAVVLLVRDARGLRRLLATVAGVSLAAGLVALVQFAGLDVFDAWPAGERQPSFVGIAELGALGGAAVAVWSIAHLRPGTLSPRVGRCALAGGVLDLVLSAGVAAELGVVVAAAATALVGRRRFGTSWGRLAAIGAAAVVCGIGVLALRAGDLAQYARYVGLAKANHATTHDVQTYAQRALMNYIGIRVWRDHPLLGTGWQSIREPQVYEPYLDDAHARYPDQPEQAFPAPSPPARQYGIDNAYVQSLAELGTVGTATFIALLAAGVALGLRGSRTPAAFLGLLWLLVSMGVWVGQGLVAGASFTALSWFALGLVAAVPDE